MKEKKQIKSKKTTSKKKVTSTKKKKTINNTKKTTSNNKKKTNKPKKEAIIKYNKIEKRNRIILYVLLGLFSLVIILVLIYKFFFIAPTLSINEVYLDDDGKVIVSFKTNSSSLNDNIYCLYTKSNNKPKSDDKNWILSNGSECNYTLDENIYHVYLKNESGSIIRAYQTDTIGTVKNLKINEKKYYLAINDTINLNITYDKLGYVDDNVKWTTSDEKIATVKDGKVKGLSNGNVIITANIKDKKISSEIIVTNLITKRPSNEFDYNKKYLSCDKYNKKENDLLDDILEFKINKVGYKTRAAVVEAARFLTLDFPYRINYFYENGRLHTNKVDGEGRYYHKGLYLDKSRYKTISHSKKGPAAWGCSVYSIPDGEKEPNGLDCSGFVSWVLLNGGYNPGDIGAGITKIKDLTDLGQLKKLNDEIINNNLIKVGDLLHNRWLGGHIAIIIGIDNSYYYVAQSIDLDENGVIVSKYKKNDLDDKFNEVILMDKYYKKDGILSNMW